MGLDMYLTKRKYVKNWEHDKANQWKVTVSKNGTPCEEKFSISEVVYDVGYWRKANQVHNWFVTNVVNSDDWHGDESYVTKDQLKELLDLCKQVKAVAKLEKAKIQNGSRGTAKGWEPIMEDGETITNPEEVHEILPTQSGFFFGSTNYDQWYMNDINETIEILEKVMEDQTTDSYYYSASW